MVPVSTHPTFPSRPGTRGRRSTGTEALERRVLLSAAAPSSADTGVFNGHTYRLVFPDTNSSWTQAQAAARAAGGHLVTINSPAEQAFVEGLLAGADAPTGAYKMGGRV